jgi:AmmeMemoRadiSam system protein B
MRRLPPGVATADKAAHDSEHSLEAVAYWLHHRRSDLEIVPVLVPAMSFDRMREVAAPAARALAEAVAALSMTPGRDVAIVISSDAVHYGADFGHTPFGAAGPDIVAAAAARDRALLDDLLSGPVTEESARALYETFVNPERPDEYRLTWCGRFSIPAGMILLSGMADSLGLGDVVATPVAYGTSVESPPLSVGDLGMGVTAPANSGHFVGHAAVGFVLAGTPRGDVALR